jgi:hypothetical protein
MAGGGLGDGEDVATRGRIDLVSIERDLDQSDRAPAVGEAHIQVPTVGCHGHAEQAALALDHHQLGQVQQRPRIQAAVADDPHPSGSLADVQGGVIVGDGQRHRLAQPGQPVQPHRHAVELGLGRRPGRGRGGSPWPGRCWRGHCAGQTGLASPGRCPGRRSQRPHGVQPVAVVAAGRSGRPQAPTLRAMATDPGRRCHDHPIGSARSSRILGAELQSGENAQKPLCIGARGCMVGTDIRFHVVGGRHTWDLERHHPGRAPAPEAASSRGRRQRWRGYFWVIAAVTAGDARVVVRPQRHRRDRCG